MNRERLHDLFRRHRGEAARLARELSVDDASLHSWFNGRINSEKIRSAVYARAEELLKREEQAPLLFQKTHPRLLKFLLATPGGVQMERAA